jgi:hypothetical protein
MICMIIYHQHNQSIHMTDGMAVMSLSTSFLQKISAATDHLCPTALKRKLLCNFEKWCKFSSCIKTKSCKSRPDCSECYSGLKLGLDTMNNDPLFLGKTCRESIKILSQNMSLPFFPLITTSSVYKRLRVKFVHSFKQVECNRKFYLTQQN